MRLRFLLAALVVCVLLGATASVYAGSPPYFMSSETGCGTNAQVILCDDFEQGDALNLPPAGPGPGSGRWASENADVANSHGGLNVRTKGWGMRIRDGYPHSECGPSVGVGGGCAARSILQDGIDGRNSALADHALAPGVSDGAGASYDGIRARFYVKLAPGFQSFGHTKFITLNRCCANGGGIDFGGAITNNWRDLQASPQWDCGDDNYHNPQGSNGQCYIDQNQGNDYTIPANGTWSIIEVEIQFNTYSVRNGIWRVWADNCGTTGLTCPANLTLRSQYTNVGWRGSGGGSNATTPNGQIGVWFFDIWGPLNGGDVGTVYLDNLKVTTIAHGTIGPVGAAPGAGNTDRQTLAGVTAVVGSQAGRVLGTVLTSRPAIRNALLIAPIFGLILIAIYVKARSRR